MNDQTKIATRGIYHALAAAQMEMGPALKDRVNPAFKQKYAELSNVIEACLPALNRHGICVLQPICDEDGKRFVKTVLAHESGETIECRVELIVAKNDMQGLGSAITYGRRYGLMAMAGIAPEDDDGNAAAKAAPVVDDRAAFEAEVSQAIRAIGREKTLKDLGEFWADFSRNHRDVATDARVLKAKEDRKTALNPAPAVPHAAADLGGDAIPY